MTTPKPLANCRVLVTRPAAQSGGLLKQLRSLGADAVSLPLINIRPLQDCAKDYLLAKQQIVDLDLYQHVIFVSSNAATLAGELIDQYWPQLPIRIQWLAIGKQTASRLADYGIQAFHSPIGYDSEALLASEALQQIEGDKILICRGRGGREKLAQELSARGALVSYAELYERCCPDYSQEQLAQSLYQQLPDTILLTSSDALKNLLELVDDGHRKAILQIPLLVPSKRTAQEACQAGFTTVISTAGADDQTMIRAVQQTLSEVGR
ncbi:uroporphyrinogen-III synthase [Pontibacter sp. JAM-7]